MPKAFLYSLEYQNLKMFFVYCRIYIHTHQQMMKSLISIEKKKNFMRDFSHQLLLMLARDAAVKAKLAITGATLLLISKVVKGLSSLGM